MGRTEANRCVRIVVLRWSPGSDPRIVSSQDSWVILSPKTIASTWRKSYTSPTRMDSDNMYLLEFIDVKIRQVPRDQLKTKGGKKCLYPFPSACIGVTAKRDLGDFLIQFFLFRCAVEVQNDRVTCRSTHSEYWQYSCWNLHLLIFSSVFFPSLRLLIFTEYCGWRSKSLGLQQPECHKSKISQKGRATPLNSRKLNEKEEYWKFSKDNLYLLLERQMWYPGCIREVFSWK